MQREREKEAQTQEREVPETEKQHGKKENRRGVRHKAKKGEEERGGEARQLSLPLVNLVLPPASPPPCCSEDAAEEGWKEEVTGGAAVAPAKVKRTYLCSSLRGGSPIQVKRGAWG